MPEPTNPFATATSLAVGTTGTHTLTATADYYRFTLSGRSSVNLTLTGLDSNVDLQLLGRSGTMLQQSTNTGTTTDDINYTDLSAGVYYIRVAAANSTTSAHYTLGLQAQTNAKTDLLWRNYTTGENALWFMNGTSLASSTLLTQVSDPHWHLEGSADFTGDGQADLVWRNQATGQNVVWQMNGTTVVTSLGLTAEPDLNWHIASVNDLDGDGQADLLWRNGATGENRVWQMQGTTAMSTLALLAVPDLNWQLVGSGDFNRDGQTDLVWRRDATGENVVWFMNGTTSLSSVFLPQVADGNWRMEGVADFNGDNQPDLVWRNYSTGQDAIWLLQGTTLLSGAGVSFTPIADLNWQIAAPFNVYAYPGLADIAGNTIATALNLGTLNGQATYHSTVSSSSSSDYYRFQLTAPDPAVSLHTSTGNLELLDSSGGLIQRVATAGAPVAIQRALDSGSYYLRVYGTTSYVLGVFDTTAPPSVTTSLVNDTALTGTNTDHWTADPTVTVQVGTNHWLGSLTAGFNATNPASFVALTPLLGNSLTLTPTQLQALNGGLALTDGSYVLHLRATGVYDVTALTTNLAFTLDTMTSAPSGLHLTTGTGNTTNVPTPTVTGQAEVGALVKVYGAGNVLLGQGVADSTGTWQATLTALTDGTYNVTAISTDGAGNGSAASAGLALTITTSLTAPTNLALTTASDQGVSSTDGITKVAAPVLQGKAKLGATVKVYDAAKVLLGQGTVDGNGNWQAPLSVLAEGSYTLQAIATDAAGNVSAAATITVTIDTTAPVVALDTNTAVVLTQQAHLSGYVDGTGSDVVSAQYHFDSLAPVALTLDAYGDFDQAFDYTGVSNGAQTLTLTTTDVAGNALTQTVAVTVNQGLTAPTLTAALAHDTGWDDTDRVTADPQVTGTLTGGNTSAHLQVGLDGAAAASFTTVALANDGTFTLDRAWLNTLAGGTLPEGDHTLHLQARDASGNLLSVADVEFALDTTAPTLTVTTPLTTPLGNGAHLAGTVSETGSGLVALQYQFDNLAPLSLSLDATGHFNEWLDFTGIADGSHTLTVSSTDGAGNVTASHFNVTVQNGVTGGTASSNFLTVALVADTGANTTDGITSNPTVTGTISAQVAKLLVGFDGTPPSGFIDVTPGTGSNGSLTLDAAAFATIYGDSLPDGVHTLRFQMLDAQGTVLGVSHVSFNLDTTAPDLSLPTLIDGIAWSPGEVLQGVLNEVNPGAVLVYNFDGGTNTTLSLDTAGGFDTVLQTLPTLPAAHTLNLLATDSAGNLQNVAYHFLIADEQPVVDTDTLGTTTPPADPKPPGGTTFVDQGQIGAAGGADGGWGFVGPGGVWGFGGGSGSGSGGNWSPSGFGGWSPSSPILPGDETPNPTDLNYIEGAGYHLDYVAAIHTLLDYAEGALSNDAATVNKKAALKHRLEVLNDIAQMVFNNPSGATLQAELKDVMHGIFSEVPLAGITKGEAVKDGYLLAQDIAKDATAVTIQVYQAELLLTVDKVLLQKNVTTTVAQQTALATALKELATTYAKLNPTVADDANTTPTPNFLDILWRAQLPINNQPRSGNEIAADLALGETALTSLLAGVNQPVQAITFINNLLKAATQVVGLQGDLHDAKFVRELVDFGFEYLKSQPVTAASSDDTPGFFLDTLWRDGNTQQGKAELSFFVLGEDTSDKKLGLIEYEKGLINEIRTSQFLNQDVSKAGFLGDILELGSLFSTSDTFSLDFQNSTPEYFIQSVLFPELSEQGIKNKSDSIKDYLNPDKNKKLNGNLSRLHDYDVFIALDVLSENIRLSQGLYDNSGQIAVPLQEGQFLDWKLVVALMERESENNPDARLFDPLQVANKDDDALNGVKSAATKSPTDRRESIIALSKLTVDSQNIGHTPFRNGAPYYRAGTVEGGGTHLIDAYKSIQIGVEWLLSKKATLDATANINGWSIPWQTAVEDYNYRGSVAYGKDVYITRYNKIKKEYEKAGIGIPY